MDDGGTPRPQYGRVLLKLDGYTHQEIAVQTGITVRSVQRKLDLIRDTWVKEVDRE